MDFKILIDALGENTRPILTALFFAVTMMVLLRSRLAKRLFASLEETFLSNWQLGLLAATGLVLSAASGWTTWDGMRNFTGEPLLSGMITFGIQGVMLIVAWLIGESFATGMSTRATPAGPSTLSPSAQTWLGAGIGLLLFLAVGALVLQWSGQADLRQADADDLSWAKIGDKFVFAAAGLLLIALFALYAASDLVKPYIQGTRVMIRNAMLWVMFLACMATSVFFSFDSLFTSIFPQSERVRAAELRAQNQVSGIISDIEGTVSARASEQASALFQSEAYVTYDQQMEGIARAAAASEGAIERYVNGQIEARRRAVNEQQERMASAQSGQAGIAAKKVSLTEEKGRLAAERPGLTTDYAGRKADLDAKLKDVDAKRVEALAEDKGVEGTGKEGRGPVYRQRMSELNLLQSAVKIAEERTKDAQKRLNQTESRLTAIDSELATIDGDLAKLKGEAETAEQRIKLAQDAVVDTNAPAIDPARILPQFEQARAKLREAPSNEALAQVQKLCGDVYGALSATPDTKALLSGLDCDPKNAADAASGLFALQAGSRVFAQTCIGGDKLAANTSADALFGFARRCLADTALPSKDTETLRTKINGIELARDDKAHRFVVTWNAFDDGNRLAYLALGIAIAIDSLIFMSGLFGANAVRSPLSDVPGVKARSAGQLEATINAALGPHPYETAWATLSALRPITNTDGFSAVADLSTMERSAADRVRIVLTAGADIGAVEAISLNPERYRVRSELREYLSTICDKHFKTDETAKDRARLNQLITSALAPHVREHADIVLHSLEPIRETNGFTSKVQLTKPSEKKGAAAERLLPPYEDRVVRRVLNAGSTVSAVAPDVSIEDRYYIRPAMYEVLLTVRATTPESPNYEYDRRRYEEANGRPAIDGGMLHAQQPRVEPAPRAAELPKPPPQLPRHVPLTQDESLRLAAHYRSTLLGAIGLDAEKVRERMQTPAAQQGMLDSWKALSAHSRKNESLDRVLNEFKEQQEELISQAYSSLLNETAGDDRKRSLLDAIEGKIGDELSYFMLFPELHLIDYLIDDIERAAQNDDGLQQGEQYLKDQLVALRDAVGNLNLAKAGSWDEIRQRLAAVYRPDIRQSFNRSPQHRNNDDSDV